MIPEQREHYSTVFFARKRALRRVLAPDLDTGSVRLEQVMLAARLHQPAFRLKGERDQPDHYVTSVQSYLMIAGAIALLLGLVFRPLAQVVGWVAWVFLTYTIEMVRLTARVPPASVPVKMENWMVWGYYGLLAGLTWWLKQARERRVELWDKFTSNVQPKAILGASAVLLVLAFFTWRGLPDGKLYVTFLNVGQGDAIFIQPPSGRQILIDGGPSDTALLSQLGRRMPFWDRSIDLVVLTHPDRVRPRHRADRVLERYRMDAVIFRQMALDSDLRALAGGGGGGESHRVRGGSGVAVGAR